MDKEESKSQTPVEKSNSKGKKGFWDKVVIPIAFLSLCVGLITLGVNWLQLRNELGSAEEDAQKRETEIAVLVQQRDLLATVAVADSNLESLLKEQITLNAEIAIFAPGVPTIPIISRAATFTPSLTLVSTSTPTLSFTPTATLTSTNTAIPTETSSPQTSPLESSVLFQDNFNKGLSTSWQINSGNPIVVNDMLTTDKNTSLTIGNNNWTNYTIKLEADARNCWFYSDVNVVGVRAQDSNNMIAWRWADCESVWYIVENGEWNEVPNSEGKQHVGYDMVSLEITADGGLFTVYANGAKLSSFFDTRYEQGKIVLQLGNETQIDNFSVSEIQ